MSMPCSLLSTSKGDASSKVPESVAGRPRRDGVRLCSARGRFAKASLSEEVVIRGSQVLTDERQEPPDSGASCAEVDRLWPQPPRLSFSVVDLEGSPLSAALGHQLGASS